MIQRANACLTGADAPVEKVAGPVRPRPNSIHDRNDVRSPAAKSERGALAGRRVEMGRFHVRFLRSRLIADALMRSQMRSMPCPVFPALPRHAAADLNTPLPTAMVDTVHNRISLARLLELAQ